MKRGRRFPLRLIRWTSLCVCMTALLTTCSMVTINAIGGKESFISNTTPSLAVTALPLMPQSPSQTYRASTDFSSAQGQLNWFYLDSTGAQMNFDGVATCGRDRKPIYSSGPEVGIPAITLTRCGNGGRRARAVFGLPAMHPMRIPIVVME